MIKQLQEQAEQFIVAIEAEKGEVDTVTEQAGLMKSKILHQRKMMGGDNAAKENEHMVQKQVRPYRDTGSFVPLAACRNRARSSIEARALACVWHCSRTAVTLAGPAYVTGTNHRKL